MPSEQSQGIQLADFLTGLVLSKFNNELTSEYKKGLIAKIENEYLQKEINHTYYGEKKFNIFKIDLNGGW